MSVQQPFSAATTVWATAQVFTAPLSERAPRERRHRLALRRTR